MVDIFDEEFEDELKRVIGDNAKADMIISATIKVISEKREENPAYYEKLSKEIQEILDLYKMGRLTDIEKLKYAKDIRSMLIKKNDKDIDKYPERIKNNIVGKAFYDNLQNEMGFLSNEIFIDTILKIDNIFREVSKKPDWENNSDIKNRIEQEIDDTLWELEEEYNIEFNNYNEIISKIRAIGINNYARL